MNKKNFYRIPVLILLAVLLFIASRESAITITDESVKFSGMYGTTISTNSITNVELRESLPEVKGRNNGITILGLRKGHFTVAEFDRVRLLLHSKSGPFIIIQSADDVIIVNYRDSQRTRAEFEKISSVTN